MARRRRAGRAGLRQGGCGRRGGERCGGLFRNREVLKAAAVLLKPLEKSTNSRGTRSDSVLFSSNANQPRPLELLRFLQMPAAPLPSAPPAASLSQPRSACPPPPRHFLSVPPIFIKTSLVPAPVLSYNSDMMLRPKYILR